MRNRLLWAAIGGLLVTYPVQPTEAQDAHPAESPSLRAVIAAPERLVPVGKPVWVECSIVNQSDKPEKLSVPGMRTDRPTPVAGLPVAHVFSGTAYGGLLVESLDTHRQWDVPMDYQPQESAPEVVLAGRSSVGAWVELSRYYPQLQAPGRYRLQWRPYDGTLISNTLVLEVAARKQAVIQTDFGDMTVEFFYRDAPEAVANFVELARSGFYNGLLFHRIEPGYFIQGGDPNGDGTGIRPDGKKLPAELSDRQQTRGMVSMARLESDPDSASCQFFICNTRMPQWDGKYTIFGQLVGEESYSTLDQLMTQPTEPNGRPRRAIVIRNIRIVNVPSSRPLEMTPPASSGASR